MNIYEKAVQHYGRVTQTAVAVEEMAELQKELIKNTFRNADNYGQVLEELADVSICLLEVQSWMKISDDELEYMMAKKLKRLEDRIDDERRSKSDTGEPCTCESCQVFYVDTDRKE